MCSPISSATWRTWSAPSATRRASLRPSSRCCAGKGTPIHDHLAWGVLGFIDGQETETHYRRVDDGGRADRAVLEEIGAVLTRKGETAHITTPSRDIHKVENPGATPSLSIHVYGCDMGRQKRRRYDPGSGAITWYSTPHDSDEIVIP